MEKQIVKKKISYIHNGNVTVCVVKFWLSKDFWNEIVDANLYKRYGSERWDEPLIVKGISKCQDGDVYDEKIGNNIAREKAFNKVTLKMHKINKAIFHFYENRGLKFAHYMSVLY